MIVMGAPMVEVGVHEAKSTLSKLLLLVEAGEEVVILRGRDPVAQLVPIAAPTRLLGEDRGHYEVPDDFDAPLSNEELERFGM